MVESESAQTRKALLDLLKYLESAVVGCSQSQDEAILASSASDYLDEAGKFFRFAHAVRILLKKYYPEGDTGDKVRSRDAKTGKWYWYGMRKIRATSRENIYINDGAFITKLDPTDLIVPADE